MQYPAGCAGSGDEPTRDSHDSAGLKIKGMRNCPRCGKPSRKLRVLGFDLTSRFTLCFGITLAYTILEVAVDLTQLNHFYRHYPTQLLGIVLAGPPRFVLLYLVWPYIIHMPHWRSTGVSWKEGIGFVLLVPVMSYLDFWIQCLLETLSQ